MKKKLKHYSISIDSEVFAVSLVENPAIEEELVFFSEDKPIEICLETNEKHMVYSAVLIPDKSIYRYQQGEEFYVQFEKDVIEKLAYQYLMQHRQDSITLDHETDAQNVTIVESWIKADMNNDKSIALGLNKDLPVGTWFVAMKVNDEETWQRIKNGELRGFSVESLVNLDEINFTKQDNMNEMTILNKIKDMVNTLMTSFQMSNKEEETKVEEVILEEQTPGLRQNDDQSVNVSDDSQQETNQVRRTTETAPEPTETELHEETTIEPEKVEETLPETPVTEPEETTVEETVEPTPAPEVKNEVDIQVKELIENLKASIDELKASNEALTQKVKTLEKQPSTKPVNVNAKPNSNRSAYEQWREQMSKMI